jgi:hypothetical protein
VSAGGVVSWLPVKEAIDAQSYDSDRKLVETVEAGL